ncbi:hypothetical protein Q5752_006818 [Cryptotrichosporon argae]
MSIYKGITPKGYFVMVFASIGGILYGFDNGWWGTVLGETTFLCDYGSVTYTDGVKSCAMSTSKQSAGSGVGPAGIMTGCLIAMWFNAQYGRKKSLFLMAILSIVGCIIEMTSSLGKTADSKFGQFLGGKIINSMAMGMAMNVVPVYLSETSQTASRGFVINMYQTIQIVGVIVAAGSVYAVSARTDKGAYLIPIGVQFIAPALILAVSWFLPESPRWLVWKGRNEDAIKSAEALFMSDKIEFDAADYVHKLSLAFEEEKKLAESTGWLDLLKQPDLRRVLLASGVQCLQQAQGSSYMTTYIVSFLISIGHASDYFSIIMALYCVYFVAIASGYFLPDYFGRRPIIIVTSIVCGACLIIVSSLTTAYPDTPAAVQKTCVGLIFIWYFAFGANGPLVWIYTAELAPTRNREKVLGVAVFSGAGVSLMITFISPYIQDAGYGNLGSKIGFLWGAFSVINVFYCYFLVPETKGKSLEQLDFLFEQKVSALKFGSYEFQDDILAVASGEIDEVVLDGKDKETTSV